MENQHSDEDLLARALRLIEAFHARGHLATREVQSILNLDRQKARRTIKRLQASGLPIHPSGVGNATEWVLDPQYRQTRLRLGFGDMLALELGHQLLGFLEGTDIETWHHELRERILPSPGSRQGHHLVNLGQKVYYQTEPYRIFTAQDEVINQIITALFSEKELQIDYQSSDEESSSHQHFQPLTLVIYRRALYLLGRTRLEPSGFTDHLLAIDRIRTVVKGDAFSYPAHHRPEKILGARFGIWKEDKVEPTVLRFSADRAKLVRSRRWHSTQQLLELPDGRVELRMKTGGRELVRFCLEWGPKVEVVQPAWLRQAVMEELQQALQNYAGPAPEPVDFSIPLPKSRRRKTASRD